MSRSKNTFRQVWEPVAGYVYVLRVDSAWCRGWKVSSAAAPTKFGMCRYHPSHNKAPLKAAERVVYARARDIEQNHWQKLYVHTYSSFLGNAAEVEFKLKERYKRFHLRGEWFNLTPRQVQNAERYLFREGQYYESL